ncbi:hypothetical protein [Saccharothrix australiensis]|nr:hypothetical protein [Saccharothrix australiensis]
MGDEPKTESIQIPDVPAEVVTALQARADAYDMPLTAYLHELLDKTTRKPMMAEWVESATDRDWGVDRETIVQALRDEREAADAQ